MDHFSLIVDNNDFTSPAGRGVRYSDPYFTPTQVTSLRCWLRYSHKAAVSADWSDIGIPQGEGQVLHVLFDSGQTGQLIVRTFEGTPFPVQYFLLLPQSPGKLFKVYYTKPTGREVLWPYKVVPWTDRATALQLLDTVVYMWPRMPNQHMGSILEPLRVVSLYVRDKGRIGLGLTMHTTEDITASPGPGWWPKEAYKVNEKAPARYVTSEEALHPPVVLWGIENKTHDYLTAITVRQESTNGEWWEDHTSRYSGCRLLQFNPEGGDPLLWGKQARDFGPLPSIDDILLGADVNVGSTTTMAPPPYGLPVADLKRLQGAWWCRRCLAESSGLDRVRAVDNGLCVMHNHLEKNTGGRTLPGLTCPESPNGRHKWSNPTFGPPVCKWGCGTLPKGH